MSMFLRDPKCIKQREFVGIPAYHEAGFLGEGITIFHDDISKNHSECCVDIMEVILPKAKVMQGRIAYTSNYYEVNAFVFHEGKQYEMDDFIESFEISQFNNSTVGIENLDMRFTHYWNERINKYNLFCTCAAGNKDNQINKYSDSFIPVGGVFFKGETEQIWPAYDDGTFVMFMGFQSGTSFAAPFLNGMGGLMRQKYGPLTQNQIESKMKEWALDLSGIGFNRQYGFGLPILR